MIHQAPGPFMQAMPVGSAYAPVQPGARLASTYGGQQFPQYVGQQPMQAPVMQAQPQTPQMQRPQVQQQQQLSQQVPAETLLQQRQPHTQTTPTASLGAAQVGLPASPKTKMASIVADQSGNAAVAPRVAAAVQHAAGGIPGVQAILPGMPAVTVQQVQGLEQRVAELELLVEQKDRQIEELQAALAKAGVRQVAPKVKPSPTKGVAPGGFQKLTGSKPHVRYIVADPNDPVDVRLEEFYNSTGSAVQFRRINHGFYRFGETIVDLKIINHKLMARTEDGWNRGKSGPIEKFLMYYENIEREKAGIMPEA